MPTATGRAFTTANFLSNLASLKAINFGSADPPGVWFVVQNSSGNSDIWVWQPTSIAAINETSVVRPDSIPPGSPGRCLKSLVDASALGGILAAIATLNAAGLIEHTTDGGASIVGLGSFARNFLASATDTAARTALNLNNVTNTSDVDKPVSTLQLTALNLKANLASPAFSGTPTVPTATAGASTTQAASTAFVTTGLALKANLASPGFTGIPTVPTATAGTNTTQVANTAFVTNAVASLVNSSPAVLDTLGELATALGNDPNFATTITALLATKAPLTSPNLVTPNLGTPSAGILTNATGLPLPTGVTGILSIDKGGTGSSTQNFVALSGNQAGIGGNKIFTGTMNITEGTQSTSTTTGAFIVGNGGGAAIQGNLYVAGFTFGGDNIALKRKYISGTSGASAGTNVNITHGLDSTKIKGISVLARQSGSPGVGIPPGSFAPGFEYGVVFNSTIIQIQLTANNSYNLYSTLVEILIDYIA